MFTVEVVSVRDSDGRGMMSQRYATAADVKRSVPKELRGMSCYCSVRIYREGVQVGRGWRTGPGGTGERWAWEIDA